jgi:hypothetical protein
MTLRKCVLLLPTTYNDGAAVPPAVLTGILAEIDRTFDGHTVAGTCEGAYRMSSGEMAHDTCLMVWVIVDADRVDVLRKHARRIARLLKQEKLYFEVTDATPEFLDPLPEEEEDEP